MQQTRVTAPDGVTVVVHALGAGPGLVILHGGGVSTRDYPRLAHALSDQFTVHLSIAGFAPTRRR